MTKNIIVIEACDGCGKTTLVNNIYNQIKATSEIPPIRIKEPMVDIPSGKFLSEWVKTHDFMDSEIHKEEALLLFSAARLGMLDRLKTYIETSESNLVLCDRFILSTCVYQDLIDSQDANGMFQGVTKEVLALTAKYIKVSQTFLLQLSPELIVERLNHRSASGGDFDLLDSKSESYYKALSDTYLRKLDILKKQFPSLTGEVHIMDASVSAEQLAKNVLQKIIK